MKTLLLDIETAPKVAHVWRFFKENISAKQVKEHGYIMSFAAKWLGEDQMFYEENRKDKEAKLLKSLSNLLDQADFVVAHNGEEFDLKEIRARCVVNNIKPFSPVKVIDTLKIARREFRFPSYSLEYLTGVLGCAVKKDGHKQFPGFELWLECLRQNDEAWKEMRLYNEQDVLALEALYLKLRPWDSRHPHVNIDGDNDEDIVCPKCGGKHVHWRGYAYTTTGMYKRYQCQDCFGWGRSRYTLLPKNENVLRVL